MSMTHPSSRGNQTRLPRPKPIITIDTFPVSREQVDDLLDKWNYVVSEISHFDNFNSINLYQNLSHIKTNWILQIEWKSSQHLNQALSHADFQAFQDFLNQWNIAISQQSESYSPQIYRKFPGINFDPDRSSPKNPWIISRYILIIILFCLAILTALIMLMFRSF
ncbi:antibiotic biosynthesis monooxygenase [Planktothricoides raciborskii]|uniref:antibiotic biosynthesis monooxygenase n=1 Tax=Planktothricoides raciborskii TaxID=132608 RepID=UPI00339C0F00